MPATKKTDPLLNGTSKQITRGELFSILMVLVFAE